MSHWSAQIRESRIPYPHRHYLQLEIQQDLPHLPGDEAGFSASEISELEYIHSTLIFRLLKKLGPWKKCFDTGIALTPLMLAVTLLTREGSMINFVREGGVGMYLILAVGVFLVGRELKNIFQLIIVRDHSHENLRLDTQSMLLGCLALMFLGFGLSILGIYVSANSALAANASSQIFMIGIKESLTPTILSVLLSAMVILAHYGTRRIMHVWNAPIAD